MIDEGLHMFVVGGHTGEFHSMTPGERADLVSIGGGLAGAAQVFAAVGNDVDSACHLVAHAARARCTGVLVHQPPHPVSDPRGYCSYVAAIACSSDLPMLLYITDPALASAAVDAVRSIETVVGVKWGIADVQLLARTVQSAEASQVDVTWICGLAERWAPFYSALHPVGFTSGLANVNPRLSIRFARAIAQGDRTAMQEMWPSVARFESMRSRNGGQNSISIIKLALSVLGRCEPTVRPPLALPAEPDAASVKALLEEWNLTADSERQRRIALSSPVPSFAPTPSTTS